MNFSFQRIGGDSGFVFIVFVYYINLFNMGIYL